ncbi:MAG: hypothetical protein GWO40_18230 [Gammaproteobacteria bacterium]|nr:hypothetical protein [Gammaproteobacteria bacterium]NIU06186.1 hypothetical protein [Gammaproteobacteria bacterium]NIX87459.1 hypothetical protein [Gammaproteobacteria bacterium]
MALQSLVTVTIDRVDARWERRGGAALGYLESILAKADPAASPTSLVMPAPKAPPAAFDEAAIDLQWRWLQLQQTFATACRLGGLDPAAWVSVRGLPMGSLDSPAILECRWRGPELINAVALWLEWSPEPPWTEGQRVEARFWWAFCADIDKIRPKCRWAIEDHLRRCIGAIP